MRKKIKWILVGLSSFLVSATCIVTPVAIKFSSINKGGESLESSSPELPQNPGKPKPEVPSNPISTAKHSLSYNNIKSINSPLEIFKQTLQYKQDYQKVLSLLEGNDGGIDGNGNKTDFVRNINSKTLTEKFFKANENIGIYGDYGATIEDKMHYSPTIELPGYFTMQIYTDKFESFESANAINSQKNIDDIIKWNPFGFLPSNLSQLFYYLDMNSISEIFSIPEIEKIKINFDDELGTLDILLIDKNNKKFIFNYNSSDNNTTKALKKNKDFRQYIYDRTIRILNPSMVQFKMITFPKKKIPLEPLPDYGTGFVIDRIKNSNLKENEYEFLVATNMHVLDYSKSFNKVREYATNIPYMSTQWDSSANPSELEKLYNDNFDGGTYYKGGVNGIGGDKITEIGNRVPYGKFSQRNTDPNVLIPLKLQKPKERDVDKAIKKETLPLNTPETNINRKNLIDTVWYTPEFKTSGVWTTKDILKPVFDVDINSLKDKNNIKENYNEWEGRYTGKISNAGADFVITRIILSKDEVEQVLPTLYEILDTEKEKDWYIGIGNNTNETEIAANSTLFTGGFPEGVYDTKKWNSGRISSQKRHIPNDPTSDPFSVQQYWTRYDEKINKKFNDYRGLSDWYKYANMNFLSLNNEENKLFNPKGMQIQKILQFPLFVASYNGSINDSDTLHGGASGSMVINSRFELVGSLFGYKIWSEDNKSQSNNFFQIFKQYTDENKNFSIIKQIKEKLANEGLLTVKLKPS